ANLRLPIVLVTHDISEVERLADHVVLMRSGRVIASGPLGTLQSDPALPLGATRGAAVTLEAIVAGYDVTYGLATLAVAGGSFTVPMQQPAVGASHRLTVRAGDVSLARDVPQATTVLNILPCRILSATASGHEMIAVLGLGEDGAGARILARVTRKSWDMLG